MTDGEEGWKGRSILVTGSSRGIGRAVALELAGRGAHVILHHRANTGAAEEVARAVRELGGTADVVSGDLSDLTEIPSVAREVLRRAPRLSGLVNNAGMYEEASLSKLTPRDWERTISLNLAAPVFLLKALAPRLARQKGAAVVNVSSILGLRSAPGAYAYQASKAALIHVTRALALELAPRIRVNAIAPGFIRTDMNQDAWTHRSFSRQVIRETPLGRWGEPEDIAAMVRVLLSPDSRFVTGETWLVDGGKGLR